MRIRVCAVSFLNTKPLVWGMMHGPQRDAVTLRFELPSACADAVAAGAVDVGIVPVVEIDRHRLPFLPGLGIASDGQVRSIFLVSKVPAEEIRTVAMDISSRTSVALAKIILATRYENRPRSVDHPPDLDAMMNVADAALIIGDPALRMNSANYRVYDLGAEWKALTGLPMVYAMWAGRRCPEDLLRESYEYGRDHLDDIIEASGLAVAREYLTRHIIFELTDEHHRGLEMFRRLREDVLNHAA